MKCLDSLTAQIYKPTVVYIVDNASTDKVVMTDKVFTENHYEKGDQHLLDKLSELFEHEVITIPWTSPGTCDPDSDKDVFGHADGFIKYVEDHHILMSNIREQSPRQADAIREVLENNGYSVTELSFDVASPNIDYNWAYINFLQISNHIILPSFGIDEDSQAASQVHNAFPPAPSALSVAATSPTGAVSCIA